MQHLRHPDHRWIARPSIRLSHSPVTSPTWTKKVRLIGSTRRASGTTSRNDDALVVRNSCYWRAHLSGLGKTLQGVDRSKGRSASCCDHTNFAAAAGCASDRGSDATRMDARSESPHLFRYASAGIGFLCVTSVETWLVDVRPEPQIATRSPSPQTAESALRFALSSRSGDCALIISDVRARVPQ